MSFTAGACLAVAAALAASPPPREETPPPVETQTVVDRIEVIGSADDDAAEAARRSSLGRDELRLLAAETLAEVMSQLPGAVVLFAAPFGGTPMVVMRGFFGGGEVDYVGLEVDGVPRAAAETGVADWQSIRLDDVERIDLLSGPAMRRGGVDPALAGLLRITSRPAGGAPRGQATVSLGSFDTRAGALSWGGEPGGWKALLAADATDTGGYREHSAAEERGATLRADRPLGRGHLSLSTRARWRDREEPGPLSENELGRDPLSSHPLFADDRERSRSWGAAARWLLVLPRAPLEARLALETRQARFLRTLLLAEGFGDRALRRIETEGWTSGLATAGEIPLGRWLGLRLSLDTRSEHAATRYRRETAAPRAADEARRERVASEIGLALRPHSRLEIDASLRGDLLRDRSRRWGTAKQEAWSPRLGVVWALAGDGRRGVELFGEAGRAFKAPTLDQLYDPRPLPGPEGDFTLSNPALVPQRSRGWEVGLRGRTAALEGRLVAYRLIVGNEIDFDPASFRYANIGRSRHQGLEASCRYQAGRLGALSFAYARSEAEAEGAFPSAQLKNIPRDVLRLAWSGGLGGGVELGLQQSFLSGRWADDAGRRRLDDVARTDLRLAREVAGLRLRVDLLNVFDDDALELAYLLPAADGSATALHGFAPAPRAFRFGVEKSW